MQVRGRGVHRGRGGGKTRGVEIKVKVFFFPESTLSRYSVVRGAFSVLSSAAFSTLYTVSTHSLFLMPSLHCCRPTGMTTERCCTTPRSVWYLEDGGWVPSASWRLCRSVTRMQTLLLIAGLSCQSIRMCCGRCVMTTQKMHTNLLLFLSCCFI